MASTIIIYRMQLRRPPSVVGAPPISPTNRTISEKYRLIV